MRKCFFSLIWMGLLLFLFVSCSGDTEKLPLKPETNTPETAPVVLELTAAEEEEITALINRKIEYGRICASTDRILGSGTIEEYNRVADERFDTWEEWIAFVESIYCVDRMERIIKAMEDEAKFINIDGYTYVQDTALSDFLSDDFTLDVEARTADRVTIKVTRIENVPHLGIINELSSTYILHKTDAGWRICK